MKRVREYHKLLKHEWEHHKVDSRLEFLIACINREGMTYDNARRLNNLDNQITEILRYSEKNCTTIFRYAKDPWSPKLKELAREIRYIIVNIKNTIRDSLDMSMVDCMTRVTQLHDKLGRKRKEYREFIKQAEAQRKIHLDERAAYHVELGKNSNAANEVKRLKNIEQQKQDSVKINCTISDYSRGVATYILIPQQCEYSHFDNFDGNIFSEDNIWRRIQEKGGEDVDHWVRVTDKTTLENMLIQWQVLHYTQTNNTLFSD